MPRVGGREDRAGAPLDRVLERELGRADVCESSPRALERELGRADVCKARPSSGGVEDTFLLECGEGKNNETHGTDEEPK